MAHVLLERVHKIEVPKRVRTKPMQVLVLGISRSGTESMAKALERLGYTTYHPQKQIVRDNDLSDNHAWCLAKRAKFDGLLPSEGGVELDAAFFDSVLGPYNAIIGFPSFCFARELVLAYPDAKVILPLRDVDSWWTSFSGPLVNTLRLRETFLAKLLFSLSRTGYWQYRLIDLIYATWRLESAKDFKASKMKWIYEEHGALVRGLVPKDRLLEWHLGEGYERLCSFLEKPLPKEPFPYGNMRVEFANRMKRVRRMILTEALWNLLYACVGMLAVGAVTAMLLSKSGVLKPLRS